MPKLPEGYSWPAPSLTTGSVEKAVSGYAEYTTVNRGFKRDYWGDGHKSYSGILHDEEKDQPIGWRDAVQNYLRKLPDGAVVEVIVRVTGEHSPLGDTRWVLLEPHRYGPVPEKNSKV